MQSQLDNTNREVQNEIIILSGLSVLSIFVGSFLLIQRDFDFWMTKPIGIFCLIFPILSFLYYLRLQYNVESEKSKFLDRILTVNPAIILLYDWKTKWTYVLSGAIPTLQYSEEEQVSMQHNLFPVLCQHEDLAKVMSDLQKSAISPEDTIIHTEWNLTSKLQEVRPFEVKLTNMTYEKNNFYILAFMEDVLEKKFLTETIEKNRNHIMEMEKYLILKNIGSGVAHEIANPLAVIKGRTQVLKSRIVQGKIDQEQIIEGLSKVENSVDKINNTILALRQLTKDNSQESIQKHNINSLFEDIDRVWGQRLKVHGFDFLIQNSDSQLTVDCRKSQIQTVLFNLITNSFEQLKAAEIKWIKLEAKDEKDEVIITVTDSGAGIPTSIQSKIFEPFFSNRTEKNSGLGLSIAKGILQDHNGSIELDTKNINTSFVIHLPKHNEKLKQAI